MSLLDKIKDAAEEFADEIGEKSGVDNSEFGELLGDLGQAVKHVSAELSAQREGVATK